MLNFYNNSDRLILSKNKILYKAVSFYIIAQGFILIFIFLVYFCLNALGLDTSRLKTVITADFILEKWYLIIFIGPIIEETAFRLGISFKIRDIALSISAFCYIFMNAVFDGYSNYIIIKLLICIFIFIIILKIPQSYLDNIKQSYKQNIIFLTVVLFGFLHLTNFNISIEYLYVYPLLCLPQIVMGMTFSYLRLNAGFIYAVIAHIIVNSFYFAFQLI